MVVSKTKLFFIQSYEEIFESKMKMDRLKEIVEFIKEIGLE